MNQPLRDAYRAAEEHVPGYGNAAAAVSAARRRRLALTLAIPVAVASVVAGSVAVTELNSGEVPRPATTRATTAASDRSPETDDASLESPEGPSSLLYRSCGENGCSLRIVVNDLGPFDAAPFHPQLVRTLAARGLDDVTMSYDGRWIGVPEGAGFTLYNLYNESQSVALPDGPPGSHWQAYYWSTDYQQLVLAQHAGDHIARYAILRLGYNDDPEVVVSKAPAGSDLLPANIGAAFYNSYSLAEPIGTSPPVSQWPRVTTQPEFFFNPPGAELGPPGLSPEDRPSDLSPCLRSNETLAGPEGVPMTFTAAPETSSDQSGATLAFRTIGDALVPTAIVRGACSPRAGAPRYDLPVSDADTTWSYLGPVDQRWSLMSREQSGGDRMDLVLVGYLDDPFVVGHVPEDAEILMPGMTFGSLE